MSNKPTKTRKSKLPCKCLRCAKSTRETHDGKTLLICQDEACDMNCHKCILRPTGSCGFKALPKVCEREKVLA